MEEKIYETLNEIFQDVFDDEDIVVDAGTNSDTIEDWDSLEHINLVVAIEKAFGLKFSMDEMVQRPFNFAIVDEVDSILIEKSLRYRCSIRTPLLSGLRLLEMCCF